MADLTAQRLTGGDTPFDQADPRTFPDGYDQVLDEVERLDDDKPDAVSTPLQITEDPATPGSWSGSVPAGRDWQSRPIVFVSDTDPKDPTDGVGGAANIVDGLDRWVDRGAGS